MPHDLPGFLRVGPEQNPGASNSGPQWPRTPYDNLKLPSGVLIGSCPDNVLRTELSRLGVEKAHTRPRNEIIEAYAMLLFEIGEQASRVAIDDWLARHRT
jgi:hypothetical protein